MGRLEKFLAELEQLSKERLRTVAAATKTADHTAIVKAGTDLREIARIRSYLEATRERATTDIAHLRNGAPIVRPTRTADSRSEPGTLSAKALGAQRTREFVARARESGVELVQRKGVIYQTTSGIPVGIATSSQHRRNHQAGSRFWWLGLPGDEFEIAVLLVDDESVGKVRALVLPPKILSDALPRLSRDARNQVKFVVNGAVDRLTLAIPGGDRIDLSNTEDDFAALR